jgi:hypothetical protein
MCDTSTLGPTSQPPQPPLHFLHMFPIVEKQYFLSLEPRIGNYIVWGSYKTWHHKDPKIMFSGDTNFENHGHKDRDD